MAGCYTFNKSWLSVFIPHGAIGQSAVCGCDISWSYSLVESIVGADNPDSIKPLIIEVK